jgi:hypothetical protein
MGIMYKFGIINYSASGLCKIGNDSGEKERKIRRGKGKKRKCSQRGLGKLKFQQNRGKICVKII